MRAGWLCPRPWLLSALPLGFLQEEPGLNTVVNAPAEECKELKRQEQDDEEEEREPEKVRVPTWPSSQGGPCACTEGCQGRARSWGRRLVSCCSYPSTGAVGPMTVISCHCA